MVKLPHWPIPHVKVESTTSLARMEELLGKLGAPHRKLPPVVHVAGTNGKGSTIAFLKSIFNRAGYKVHRYTSPHLMRYNERIMLADQEIDDGFLYRIIEETRMAAMDMPLSFFEGTTAAALLAFSKVEADVCLIETGMGGRLDPTNVLKNKALTIITPISFDHMEHLGNTLSQIAAEKAGIVEQEVPCVIAPQASEVEEVLYSACLQKEAPIVAYPYNWNFDFDEEHWVFHDENQAYPFPYPNLYGKHQVTNAATAIAAIQCLTKFDFRVSHIIEGLQQAHWPARMEKITKGLLYAALPPRWELWLDGAHNVGGAQMLANIVENWQDRPLYLINGRTKDRDIGAFLECFIGKVKKVIGVRVEYEPLAESAQKISEVARQLGFATYTADSLLDAVKHCISDSATESRILICGSLYLASDVQLING